MARTPTRVPSPISQRSSETSSKLLVRQGKEIDVAIGGVPFLLATSQDLPQSVETIQQRKDQLDVEAEPGEQSLSAWWRRSQESFHEGSGNLYQEPRTNDRPSSGFFDSRGVDIWTQGELALLRKMDQTSATGFDRLRSHTSGLSAVKSGQLYSGADPASLASLHAPASKTVVDGFVSGSHFYDVASDGSLYEGTVAAPGSATTWPLGDVVTELAFGKHRLWAIGGRKIWQPDLSLAGGTAQDPIFTHPNQGWTYTCMAEGPQAMYFGGHDGRSSSIQAITLDADGGIPALSGAQVTAILPDGELIQRLAVLAGQFVGIATNKGFRIGVIDGAGIAYGPILFAPDNLVSCSTVSTQDRFFLIAFETSDQGAELWKVDTGLQLADGVFPYARDIECGAGYLTSVVVEDDRVIVTDDTGDIWHQSATELVASGYLQTGRIRYRTTERKLFKYIELDTEPLYGNVKVDGIDENDSVFQITTFSSSSHDSGTSAVPLPSALGPQRHVAFKFTLGRDPSDSTAGPVIRSYLVRALPSSKPQRMITLPLLCYDREQGHSGMRYGYDGYAADRLSILQEIENIGDTVVYQNFAFQGDGQIVVIDNIRFIQNAPSTPRQYASGRGGILIIQLRTVTA